jgi:predicted lipoprotein with Yx(FWY)xxD motif
MLPGQNTARRALIVMLAGGLAVTSAACGKTITIGDKTAPATQAAVPETTAPVAAEPTAEPAEAGDQSAGNTALQVLDTTAEENGKKGNGGTTVGIAIQQTPPKWVQLTAITSMSLEKPYLVNINEAALYRFAKDSVDPSESNCDGDCATQWPPVTVKDGGAVFLDGVADDQVDAIRRSDGQIQLTVGGSPVYRFTGDSKPGDLKGQGVNGTWFAVGPDGEAVK